MSHFSVLVVTNEQPTHEILAKVLQPLHEFECTGVDDEYVVEVDETEEKRKEYETGKVTRLLIAGEYHDPYDDRFYREPTAEESAKIGPIAGTGCGNGLIWTSKDWKDGRGYRTKIRFVPDGAEEAEINRSSIMTFRQYIEDYLECKIRAYDEPMSEEFRYGYAQLSESGEIVKIVDRTNPNAKWDWWVIGGRYTGKLQAKFEWQDEAYQAKPSKSWELEGVEIPKGFDVCQKKNLDAKSMKAQSVIKRQKWVDQCCENAGIDAATLELGIRESEAAHKLWMELPEPKPCGGGYSEWLKERGFENAVKARVKNFELPDPPADMTLSEWISAAPWLTSFAFLRDGKWASEGDMGWFACVSNENPDWSRDFQALVEDVPDECWLSVIDCHI